MIFAILLMICAMCAIILGLVMCAGDARDERQALADRVERAHRQPVAAQPVAQASGRAGFLTAEDLYELMFGDLI